MTSQAKLLLIGLAVALLSVAGEEAVRAQTGKTKPRTKTAVRAPAAGRAVLDASAEAERPERPHGGAVLAVQPVTPELEKILKEWETHSSKIVKLQGGFVKFQYNGVFLTEKRSNGKFYYEQPDKGFYNVEGDTSKGLKPSRKDEGWKVEPGKNERWLCDGKAIYAINDSEKSYEIHEIPPESRGKNIIDGPLPFLFGMKADEAKKRYKLKLVKRTATEIWIEALPMRQQDLANWTRATVILDPKTFLPKAVQLFEPGEGCDTVHHFGDLEQPDKRGLLDFGKFFRHHPLKLEVPKGYRLVSNADKGEPDRAGIAQIGPEPPGVPPRASVKPRIQQAAAVAVVNFASLKLELQKARTKTDLQQASRHLSDVWNADVKVKAAGGEPTLSQEQIAELVALQKKRFSELSK